MAPFGVNIAPRQEPLIAQFEKTPPKTISRSGVLIGNWFLGIWLDAIGKNYRVTATLESNVRAFLAVIGLVLTVVHIPSSN
jgi:hypothetical protein